MSYGVVVFLVGLGVTPLALFVMRRVGVVDVPNERSSHVRPTVRGAGLGVALVASGALVVAAVSGEDSVLLLIGVAALAYAALGLADDMRDLDAMQRLSMQIAIGAVVVVALGTVRPLLLALLAVVAVAGYLNAFNFMDGINGISGLHALVVGVVWSVAGGIADVGIAVLLGSVVAGAALAFLPFNFPRARGFLGDVGSYFFGGYIAVGAVALYGAIPAIVIVLPLLPYVADTAWTLYRRVQRGEVWHEAHREHVYQRLLNTGWSHTASALLMACLTVLSGAGGLAIAYATDSKTLRAALLATVGGAIALYLSLPNLLGEKTATAPVDA